MAAKSIETFTNNLAGLSLKSHAIVLCIIAVPVLISVAWVAFPVLEARNFGYRFWHFSCHSGLLIAGFGIVCWIAEKVHAEKAPSWIALVFLCGVAVAAIALRFFGDFYWAFDRGHFLD